MLRVAAVLTFALLMAFPASVAGALPSNTQFFTPTPNPGATRQIRDLRAAGKHALADKIQAMVRVPSAVWFAWGTPADIKSYAEEVLAEADEAGKVPILVVYNVPGRDCGLYSDGGAATGAEYREWIDGIAEAVGTARAMVIVEPDGLPLLPSDCGQADPYNRIGLIQYAANKFDENPNAAVYIDAGNSNWHNVPTIARRLVQAGVGSVDGFALNVSNYQFTVNSNQFGTWVSKCIAYATGPAAGSYDDCPDQYGSYGGVALTSYAKWSNSASAANRNTSAENARYAQLLNGEAAATRFVVDTSRNGTGPWPGTQAHPASESDTEAWCNPPNRGAGRRTTAATNVALVDAYVWIKLPGESDGECYRWTDGPKDPVRGVRDPSAGSWFRQQASELARFAVPAFP